MILEDFGDNGLVIRLDIRFWNRSGELCGCDVTGNLRANGNRVDKGREV